MSTEWIVKACERQHLTKQTQLIGENDSRYLQDDKLFVCDCSCNEVWQTSWYGEIDSYKDFPTIGKKRKRMPGHEK